MSDAPTPSAPLRRAAQVLEAVARAPGGLGVAAIARKTGLPMPSAHRIVRSLLGLGYLEGGGRGAPCRLGPRLLALARPAADLARIAEAATRVLPPYAERLGAVGFLTHCEAGRVSTLYQAVPRAPKGPIVLPGTDLPLHATASGKVFLAAMEKAALARALSGRLTRFRPATITEATRFGRVLTTIRMRGYAVSRGEYDEGVYSIACPVAIPGHELPLACGFVGFESALLRRHDEAGLARLAKRTAAEIGAALGSA